MNQVRDLLVETNRVIEEAEVPENCRPAVYGKVFDYLVAQSASASPAFDNHSVPNEQIVGPIERISQSSGIDLDTIYSVYADEDGDLRLVITPSLLTDKVSPATRDIATLLVAGRTWAGLGEWTPLDHIRRACEDLGRYDSSNFSGTITNLSWLARRGKGKDRAFRINQVGLEQAKTLIRTLIEGDQF